MASYQIMFNEMLPNNANQSQDMVINSEYLNITQT